MAEFSSGGGDIPISRRVGHAHVLKTAPAYSFGSKCANRNGERGVLLPVGLSRRTTVTVLSLPVAYWSAGEDTPAPHDYGMLGGLNTSGIGFGSSNRGRLSLNDGPAGTDYNVKVQQVTPSKPAYTFGGKHRGGEAPHGPSQAQRGLSNTAARLDMHQQKADAVRTRQTRPLHDPPPSPHRAEHTANGTPSPDHYAASHALTKPAAPSFSLSKRREDSLYASGPGPGQVRKRSSAAQAWKPGRHGGGSTGEPLPRAERAAVSPSSPLPPAVQPRGRQRPPGREP
jgi:hypothetical protein